MTAQKVAALRYVKAVLKRRARAAYQRTHQGNKRPTTLGFRSGDNRHQCFRQPSGPFERSSGR